MDSFEPDVNGSGDNLPPPPPIVPPNVEPEKVEQELPPEPVKKKDSRLPMARRGVGSKGSKIPILTNHFKVNVCNNDGHFFHYSVCSSVSLAVLFYLFSGLIKHSRLDLFTFYLSRYLFLMKMDAL